MGNSETLRRVCEMLTDGDAVAASQTLARAFAPPTQASKRSSWSRSRMLGVFVRDGFTDRYFGEPLVFPGALRAISVLLPAQFPYHPNWKQSRTHPAYWTLYPTLDHVVPVARGGADDEANVVTTSMLRNAAKSNWLLSELGWPEERAAVAANWDGLLPWFCREYEKDERLRSESALRAWYRVAKRVI